MKIKQIAFYVPQIEVAKSLMAEIFGFDFPIKDSLDFDGLVSKNSSGSVRTDLYFHHGMLDELDEFEYIDTHQNNIHWHSEMHRKNFGLSHLGIYCENIGEFYAACDKLHRKGFDVLQETKSKNHTRKNSDGTERSYLDAIFDTEHLIGFNIKLTVRV